MTLLDDIYQWSRDLPGWQRDALRRLFQSAKLSANDIQELIAMVKQEHGKGSVAEVQPLPLDLSHIPHAGIRSTITLLGLSELQNVNRFPTGREANFAATGLSVLFGENAAGKSGYARVLKNACRARTRQPVLPNAFDSTEPPPVPSAKVTFSVDNGTPQTVAWQQGGDSSSALASVAVYDTACGADYTAKEGASDYQPYGLPHLNRLAALQRHMQQEIEKERNQVRVDPNAFADLKGDTVVGNLLSSLSRTTDLERLRALSTLTPVELKRIEGITTTLNTMDPAPAARTANLLADRIEGIANLAREAQRWVSEVALDEVKKRKDRQQTTQSVWAIAQQKLHQSESGEDAGLLPGTGSDVWKALFEAAEKFSTEQAYPGHAHPNVDDHARCVLCQSPLAADAKARMVRFGEFVANEASKAASDASDQITTTMEKIAQANLNPIDAPTMEELATLDSDLHAFVKTTIDSWKARREWIQAAVTSGEWSTARPSLPEGDTLEIRLLSKSQVLRNQAGELLKSQDPRSKAALEQEQRELKARQALGSRMGDIERYVADSSLHHNLNACATALNPRRVSVKMTELAKAHVTEALASALNAELIALGYRKKEAHIAGRTDVGNTMVTLRLKDCRFGTNDVLSEGEQRTVGLALFIAEARLSGHASTIVFDDPATSLDHRNRRRIAERLAKLAQERPVLMLTHDAVLLTEIDRAARKNEQSVSYQTVGWDTSDPGLVSPGLTWETMDVNARAQELEVAATELRKQIGDHMDAQTQEKVKAAYTKLRGTIERAVREVFLNSTIKPYSDEVSVDNFGAVIGHPQSEWDSIYEIYERCCEVTDAHDTNGEHQLAIPEVSELLKDIATFQTLLANAARRKKDYNTQRAERNTARKKAFERKS
ncbi:AAA family ATPase [Dyella subtropica]|uniref:AAA family ATPase n=1 Tax=Dyella subtropica TaxID=2992127 RepID=UPI00224EB12A|nr:AAA family ATPase [Dyella subtropica]